MGGERDGTSRACVCTKLCLTKAVHKIALRRCDYGGYIELDESAEGRARGDEAAAQHGSRPQRPMHCIHPPSLSGLCPPTSICSTTSTTRLVSHAVIHTHTLSPLGAFGIIPLATGCTSSRSSPSSI